MAAGISGLKPLLVTSLSSKRGSDNYAKSLTWNSYISEFGTQDERNDGRTQETAVLAFVSFSSVPCQASTVPFPMTPPYVGGASSFLSPFHSR